MLAISVSFSDKSAMEMHASQRSVFSFAAVARRESVASRIGVGGEFGVLGIRTGKKTDMLPDARQHFSGKLAVECSATFAGQSPNKAPEPTTMAVTPRATEGISK